MSRLAETFESSQDQENALKQIGGFKQSIQVEILKRSEGDLDKLPELRTAAMEGAFDVRSCSEGLCFEMPEELKAEVKRVIREKGDLTRVIRALKSH